MAMMNEVYEQRAKSTLIADCKNDDPRDHPEDNY